MVNEDKTCCSAGPRKPTKHECVNCSNYKRKVCEAQKTVSARDVLIGMLQKELKRVENLYKNSIDEYENLRFNYCSTMHQLSNLRAIHKKLKDDHLKVVKERDSAKNQLYTLQNEWEKCRNQNKALEKFNQTETELNIIAVNPPNCPHKNIIKEVINIESNIQNQNKRLKDLMCKLLNEAQGSCSTDIEDIIDNEISKSKSGRELISIVEELSKQIDNLNNFVVTLKSENDSIKYQLTEKISNLSSCLCDLEKNHSNINNLSETIESIISEKENYHQKIKNLTNVIETNNEQLKTSEGEISELKHQYDDIKQEAEKLRGEKLQLQDHLNECLQHGVELQQEYSTKEETWNTAKSKLMDDIKQMEQNNKELNDMLETLTNENKSNLEKITALNRDLIETRKEAETCECVLKNKNLELAEEIEKIKKEKQQKENEAESRTSKFDEDISLLNNKIKSLEKNIEELTLENSEYEEENKYYCQQLNSLVSQMRELEKEKIEADENNGECCRIIENLKENYEKLESQKNGELKELKEEINEIKKNQDLWEKDKDDSKNIITVMEEELKNVKTLKAMIENENDNLKNQINKLQTELHESEKEKDDFKNKSALMEDELKNAKSLTAKNETENSNLRNQISNLQAELSDIHQTTESQILDLQEKITELEKQQVEKSKQIVNCSQQLEFIKKISDEQKLENEKYLSTLQNLEKQKALLEEEKSKLDNETRQNVEEIERLSNRIQECKETAIKNENDMKDIKSINEKLHEKVETMSVECCREERLINHLEQCIENSNNMLEECERQLKQLHIEKEILENENEVLKTSLEKYICDAVDNESQKNLLQQEANDRAEHRKSKDETTNTTGELNKILEDNKEKDHEIEDLRKKLELIQESSQMYKSEYEKLKKAYTEIKDSLTERMKKYNTETQDLNKDNIDFEICCDTEMIESKLNLEKRINELESTILEKEMAIKNLQYRLKQSSGEICQLKSYMDKLISDNKNLKHSIDNLLNTLTEKFRTFSETGNDIEECTSAVSIMMQDILGSLIHLEKHITRNSNDCSLERCNCMSVISSQYKYDNSKASTQYVGTSNLPCQKTITVLKKCDNINVESSYEIIGICTECCQDQADCCNSSSDLVAVDHEDKPSQGLLQLEYRPEDSLSDEPFTIEPDNNNNE